MPLLWGGLACGIGGVVDLLRWLTVIPKVIHENEAFHLAVLAGATFHWLFIRQFATGEVQPPRSDVAPHPSR